MNNDRGNPCLMLVQLQGSEDTSLTKLRAATTNPEDSVKNGIIMVFRGNSPGSILDGVQTFDFSSTGSRNILVNVTQGMRYIYVVANTDVTRFANVSTLQDLYNLSSKASFADLYTTKGICLPMSNAPTNNDNQIDARTATKQNPVNVTVTLKYLCSKVKLVFDATNIESQITGFSVTGAYLLNAKGYSDYFAASGNNMTTNVTSYFEGLASASSYSSGTFYPPSPNTNNLSSYLGVNNFTNATKDSVYFYAYENNTLSVNSPTIAVMEATQNGKKYFYPIPLRLSSSDTNYKTQRNTIYNVKTVIQGLGNDNPYDPVTAGSAKVIVTMASWGPDFVIDQDVN